MTRMNRPSSTWRRLAIPASLTLVAVWIAAQVAPSRAAESRAHVRLVRLLGEVPDSDRAVLGHTHDLRLRLEQGNVLLLRKGGEFAAVLPIEGVTGGKDSLRYFYYVEHPAFLWVFPGQKDKGLKTVADGGSIVFNRFELKWRSAPGGLGWIYFPDDEASRNMRFSVVSGRTVDEADPKDTKYWIELGSPEASGF